MISPATLQTPTATVHRAPSMLLQRACACGKHTTTGGECEECKKRHSGVLQRVAVAPGQVDSAPPIVHEVLRSSGQSLGAATRAFMEPRFGHDFSQVRVHMDAQAAESARAVNALAYTVGRHIVFASSQDPCTTAKRELLAHELTHVVQQANTGPGLPDRLSIGPVHDPFERQADSLAKEVTAAPQVAENAVAVASQRVQRQTDEVKGAEAQNEGSSSEFRLPTVNLRRRPKRRPSLLQPGKESRLKLDPESFCTQRILAEGTCKDLALGSKYICCDPANGYDRPARSTSIAEPGKTCKSKKWTPIFTCDNNCATAVSKGCDDNDHWMALPPKEFKLAKCNTQYMICANGRRSWGYVRDNSSTHKSYEVSPGIQRDLRIKVGETFQGTVYPPGTDEGLMRINPCCNWPPLVLPDQLNLQLGEMMSQPMSRGASQNGGSLSIDEE